MLTLEVTGLEALQAFAQALQAPFPTDAHAEAAGAVQALWQAAATGTVLPPMTQAVNKPDLAQSVQVTVDGDGATVSADASLMPDGTAARDMKCIVDWRSKVFTRDGWKMIRDVTTDDWVLTHKGRFRRVEATSQDPLEPGAQYYRIKIPWGDSKGAQSPQALSVTPNHPFLTPRGWVRADRLQLSDTLLMLGYPCANPRCESLAPWYRETCSSSCAQSLRNLRSKANGNHPMLKPENRQRQSRWIRQLTRQMLEEGTHVTQREDVKAHWRQRIAVGEHPFQVYWREHPEELMRKSSEAVGRIHHGKSSLEDRMAQMLENMGIVVGWANDANGAQMLRQYKFVREALKNNKKHFTRHRWYFLDFADPAQKIAIECNGEHWHTPEKDAIRREELETAGWTVLMFPSKQIYGDPGSVLRSIAAVYSNHTGEYGFVSVPIKGIEVKTRFRNLDGLARWNLQVEEDESFICNGIVVHNSGLLNGPHSRLGQHGRYTIIPLRHDAASLPSHIASQLVNGGTVTSAEGIRSKILNGGSPVLAYHAASGTFQVVSHYTWQTGLYTGMRIGMHKDYPVGPVTFRTVSERSAPSSWWYPAKPGQPLVEAVSRASLPIVADIYTHWWEARLHAH